MWKKFYPIDNSKMGSQAACGPGGMEGNFVALRRPCDRGAVPSCTAVTTKAPEACCCGACTRRDYGRATAPPEKTGKAVS